MLVAVQNQPIWAARPQNVGDFALRSGRPGFMRRDDDRCHMALGQCPSAAAARSAGCAWRTAANCNEAGATPKSRTKKARAKPRARTSFVARFVTEMRPSRLVVAVAIVPEIVEM